MIIARNKYLKVLLDNRHNGLVKIVTGIRSGKSFSLKRIDDGFQRVIIVGDHTISSHDENGILFINIYNFLLELDCI